MEHISGNIEFMLEIATQTPNKKLKQAAEEVLGRRKKGKSQTGLQLTMQMKEGAEEHMKKDKNFLYGNLGMIYALAIGGEPVLDFRTIPGTVEPLSLRMTINRHSRQASSGLSRFNPYTDLR